jgi:hypothetical protein
MQVIRTRAKESVLTSYQRVLILKRSADLRKIGTPLFTFSNTGVRSVGARLQSIVFRKVRFIRRGSLMFAAEYKSLIINLQTEPEPVKCYLENNRICVLENALIFMPDEGLEVYILNG